MEIIQSSKKMEGNLEKISLKGYYLSLPERIAPKQRLLEEIQQKCKEKTGTTPTMTSIRNWVLYDMRPKNPLYIEAIVEVTGIKEEDLWQD
jgi:hypothetical protein